MKPIDKLPLEKQSGRYALMSTLAQELSRTTDSEENQELKACLKAIAIVAQRMSRNTMRYADAGMDAETFRRKQEEARERIGDEEMRRRVDGMVEQILAECREDWQQ